MIREYLGNYPRIKIMEFLIHNRKKGYGIKEIMLGANVKHRNLILVLNDLIEKDLAYIERKIGKSNLYKINDLNPFIQSLIFISRGNKS